MNKKFHLFCLVSLLAFIWNFTSCSWMGDSVGEDDQIVVFADSLDWPLYKDALYAVFGKQYKAPILEHDFLIRWESFKNFDQFKNQKNVFILGRLDSKEPVSANVQELLNPEVIAGVKSGKYFYIPKPEAWAVKQYVLILVANSREDMIQKIHDLGDLMYRDFRRYYFNRLRERMFSRMEQKKVQSYLEDHFPFTMRIQHDYFIADENLQENYVWIRRLHPDRSILVHWLPLPEDFSLTSRWVIDERNRLAKKIYKGDVVVEDETRALATRFKNWRAIRLEGTWRNDEYLIGGPFRSYTFVDSTLNRLYMLDYYVQAIGQRKKPYLDQLEVIVRTFRPLVEPKQINIEKADKKEVAAGL